MSRRPSAFERRRRQARTIAVVLALALVALVALPLLAFATGSPAADVDAGAAATTPVPAEAVDALGDGAGDARSVWLWSTGLLDGTSSVDAPLVAADQWVAAVPAGPAPTAVRTVWRDPAAGAVVVAGDVPGPVAAAALSRLGAADVLVLDRGEWLVLTDGLVRSLVADDASATVPTPVALELYAADRAAQYAADLRAGASSGGDGSKGGAAGGPSTGSSDGADASRVVGGRALTTVGLALAVLTAAGVAVTAAVRARRADPSPSGTAGGGPVGGAR